MTDTNVGEYNCRYRVAAGSYYDILPWADCSKLPDSIGSLQMCDIDAGQECRFIGKKIWLSKVGKRQ